jgi:hypothetical protein
VPIGKDGTYKVTTLQGGNMLYVTPSPEVLNKNPGLATSMKEYDVPPGDSTFASEDGVNKWMLHQCNHYLMGDVVFSGGLRSSHSN